MTCYLLDENLPRRLTFTPSLPYVVVAISRPSGRRADARVVHAGRTAKSGRTGADAGFQAAPLEAEGAPQTAEPDMMTGTR